VNGVIGDPHYNWDNGYWSKYLAWPTYGYYLQALAKGGP